MGANVSTQVQRVTQIVENTSKATCKQSADVRQEMKGLRIKLVGANCGDILIQNKARIAQDCDMDSLAKALAEASMELDTEQTASLGFFPNVDTGVQERESILKTHLEQECGTDAKLKQNIEDVEIELKPYEDSRGRVYPPSCDTIGILNDAGVTQQCVMKQAIDAIDKSAQGKKSKQTQKFPIGLSIGIGLGVIGLVVVAVVIVMVLKGGKKDDGAEGAEGGELTDADFADADAAGQFGGKRKRRRGAKRLFTSSGQINWRNVPVTVIGIMMLVWYAKATEGRRV